MPNACNQKKTDFSFMIYLAHSSQQISIKDKQSQKNQTVYLNKLNNSLTIHQFRYFQDIAKKVKQNNIFRKITLAKLIKVSPQSFLSLFQEVSTLQMPCLKTASNYISLPMLQLSFSVKGDIHQGEKLKIVGSIQELGSWNPQKALHLQYKKGSWQGPILETQPGTKFEFKVIKIKSNGEIEWQDLPNNSNRKFKPKCPSQIHLQWGKAEGRVTPLTRGTFKVQGYPGVMVNKMKHLDSKNPKLEQVFDPYKDARDDQSGESDEEEFFLVRRKMSDEIVINSGDLEEIYYNNSTLEIFSNLLKKTKLYVISKEFDPNNPLHVLLEQQMSQMPPNFMTKWINANCFLGMEPVSMKLRRRSSVFDVGKQELHLDNLYSRTSYFVILDLNTAITLTLSSIKVPTCLYLPSSFYKEVIDSLPLLSNIQLICFDKPEANRQFYEYLKGTQQQAAGQQSEGSNMLTTTPSVEAIIKELSRVRYQQPVVLNTIGSITENEGINIISQQNTICILDGEVFQNYPQFMRNLIFSIHHHSLLVIVCDQFPTENVLSLRDEKNIVIVYDNFEKIVLQGVEYHPLRRFREALQTFRMKSKLYLQRYGGEIVEKESSIYYYLPQGRQDWAIKIENQCQNMVKKFRCFKVTCKGTRVKVAWNLAKEVRLIRTICEIKYTNFGSLGAFNLVTECKDFKQLKEDLRLIIEHKPQLFKDGTQTKISYYSFGSKQPSSLTIIPNETAATS